MTKAYQLVTNDFVIVHSSTAATLVRDQDNANDNNLAVDVLVASGDCFETLASQLEAYYANQQSLPPEIEHLTHTLLNLQRRYRVVKKDY